MCCKNKNFHKFVDPCIITFILIMFVGYFFFLTDRPIASIAFHAKGDLLAVASGHKVLSFSFKTFHIDLVCL